MRSAKSRYLFTTSAFPLGQKGHRILEATESSLRLASPSPGDHALHFGLIFGVTFGSVPFLFLVARSYIPPEGPSFALLSVILLGFIATFLLLGRLMIWYALRLEFSRTVRRPERVSNVTVRSVQPDALRMLILNVAVGEKEGSLIVSARPGRLRRALELAGQTFLELAPDQNEQSS